ncbi:PhnD/SsuA/transferrin family substrate-binding protein [Pararhodospirillum photometricum]|uniref:PhnD/SsuA/transferrin family substrate-binding protein n=1 Tax=Pararhodospirillum photometricum TaxID=1084 RepID=UPI00030476DB|nr:PhnD/SsuA/transferrin family substrate-binding protein [Pararhodospirillum photometricum]
MNKILVVLFVFLTGLGAVQADEPLRVGLLACRDVARTRAQWQPLAQYLQEALGGSVVVEAYGTPEMNAAVSAVALDVVITNPSHYSVLKARSAVSAPVATKVVREGEKALSSFGGVILGRADDPQITTLSDLVGKRVATPSVESLGSFQVQAFELLAAGVPIPQGEQILVTGMPHDRAVEALLEGRVDVAFVHTSEMEAMVAKGTLDPASVRVLHRQEEPFFPHATSTRLYPEWPVAVRPGLEADRARRLTVALLTLGEHTELAHALGIEGFTIPADYGPVEEVLHRMRAPPFDAPPFFSLADLWGRYRSAVVAVLVFCLLLGAAVGILEWQNKRVRQGRLRFSKLFEASPQPMLILVEDRFTECNAAALHVLGCRSKSEIVGRGPLDISPEIQPDGRPSRQIHEEIRQAALGGQSPCFEWVHARADGSPMITYVCINRIDLDLRPALVCVWHDITRSKALEAELQRSNTELEHFAHVASHDLRQPLRMVSSYLDLINRRLGPDATGEMRDFIDFALGGARRMDQLIVALLDYSRVGSLTTPRESIDLATVVREALENLRVATRESEARIDLGTPLPTVLGNRIDLVRLFQNLIGNAITYRQKTLSPVISVSGWNSGKEVVIEVTDNGIGIASEDQDRVFALFQRARTDEPREGTGLGLAVCKKIMTRHGGRITVRSQPGRGSTFVLSFPKGAGG